MPVFKRQPKVEEPELRIPQARVLRALMPIEPNSSISEWPLLTRSQLAVKAGYTAISGSITRALNGIYSGSSSGDPHIGLLGLSYVEVITLDIEGVSEANYRITTKGIQAFQKYINDGGKLPEVRDASLCTNIRYLSEE